MEVTCILLHLGKTLLDLGRRPRQTIWVWVNLPYSNLEVIFRSKSRLKDSVQCQIMIFEYSVYYCPLSYSKQNLRLMKNLKQKVYKTMVFEIILPKVLRK